MSDNECACGLHQIPASRSLGSTGDRCARCQAQGVQGLILFYRILGAYSTVCIHQGCTWIQSFIRQGFFLRATAPCLLHANASASTDMFSHHCHQLSRTLALDHCPDIHQSSLRVTNTSPVHGPNRGVQIGNSASARTVLDTQLSRRYGRCVADHPLRSHLRDLCSIRTQDLPTDQRPSSEISFHLFSSFLWILAATFLPYFFLEAVLPIVPLDLQGTLALTLHTKIASRPQLVDC
eukprot:SAG31_NODE_15556_length_749_cov_0.900000_1_plen_235_part_10